MSTNHIRPPVVISFFTRDDYYVQKAQDLKAQCDRLGLPHDICELASEPGESWAQICRKKIRFYKDMLEKHRHDVMWIDVDTKLTGDLKTLNQGPHDLALFMRGLRYLPRDDVATIPRLFQPSYVLFRNTPKVFAFLDDCLQIDSEETADVTDDFILDEAFRRSPVNLRLLILSPDDVQYSDDEAKKAPLFLHGDSGNVKVFRSQVVQHQPRIYENGAALSVYWRALEHFAQVDNQSALIALLEYMYEKYPDNTRVFGRLLRALSGAKVPERYKELIEQGMQSTALRQTTLFFELLRHLKQKHWDKADGIMTEITETGDKELREKAVSRMFRHSLDRRAQDRNIPDGDRFQVFWREKPYPGNLGDVLTPYLIESLTGIPPKFVTSSKGTLATGSHIHLARERSTVWGSGTTHAGFSLNANADYRAVRGPLTRDTVLANGGTCPEIYGDPAWVLPILHPAKPNQQGGIGLVLSADQANVCPGLGEDVHMISTQRVGYDQIGDFLDQVTSCSRVISTSLYGLAIAHAYGIPAAYAALSAANTQWHENDVKFRDYFLSVGLENVRKPIDLGQFDLIGPDSVPDDAFCLPARPIALTPLLDVAPFDVPPDMMAKAQAFDAGVPFDAAMAPPVRRTTSPQSAIPAGNGKGFLLARRVARRLRRALHRP